jgi:hypothetical protein
MDGEWKRRKQNGDRRCGRFNQAATGGPREFIGERSWLSTWTTRAGASAATDRP